MNFTTHGTGKRRERRLITTLAALFLPMLALAFLSGSFFKAGTLQPGEVVQAAGMQHMVMAPARESETETRTPGSTTTAQTTGTAVSTGTAQTTSTAQASGTSQVTGTA